MQVRLICSMLLYDLDLNLSIFIHTHELKSNECRVSNRLVLAQQSHLSKAEIQYAMSLGSFLYRFP